MKIIIPGGTGQIGALLARGLVGHEVVVFGRRSPGWAVIDGADVVINLAGRSVNCRYNAANRRAIIESRVETTRAVGEAIRRARRPPLVWLQMSTATIYAHSFDVVQDELTGVLGTVQDDVPETWRFSHDVALKWEAACHSEQVPAGTRKVLLRTAMVMSPDAGGVFDVLLGLVRRGLGGTNGDGRQYVTWIHEFDFLRAILWLIEREDFTGAVNLVSPGAVPNEEFMRELRRAAGARLGLPATRWMLEVGAFLMRTETELILKSRRVGPGRLVGAGFGFEYPEWGGAARELLGRRGMDH